MGVITRDSETALEVIQFLVKLKDWPIWEEKFWQEPNEKVSRTYF